jgi:ABC-type transport system substrate-binding protein
MTFPYEVTIPLLKDIKSQAPNAICELRPRNVSTQLLVNRDAPPFNDADLRRALALTLDRKSFIDILGEGQGDVGGAMLPPPEGLWGMPSEMLKRLPGYDPDVKKEDRERARKLMQRLGYGPDKRLPIKIAARNIPLYRDPAVILIDQLKEIYIDGELELIETANWFPKLAPAKTTCSVWKTRVVVWTTPTSNFMRTTLVLRSPRRSRSLGDRLFECLMHSSQTSLGTSRVLLRCRQPWDVGANSVLEAFGQCSDVFDLADRADWFRACKFCR